MESHKLERLKRYFKNADRFFWGIIPGNKKDIYQILNEKMQKNYYGPYEEVVNKILSDYSNNFDEVIKIVKEIVQNKVYNEVDEKSMLKLRNLWQNGGKIDIERLEMVEKIKHKLIEKNPARSLFFDLDSYTLSKDETKLGLNPNPDTNKTKYVARWNEFAKIWFEELDTEAENEQIQCVLEEKIPGHSLTSSSLEITQKLFDILVDIPHSATDDKNLQIREKILVLLALGKIPEVKPVFDQLTGIVDLGKLMEKVIN